MRIGQSGRQFSRLQTVWALCLVNAAASAQVLPDSLRSCRDETDDARRLQCYDREMAKFTMTPEQSFGLNEAQLKAALPPSSAANAKVQKLNANVAAISMLQRGAFVVTLDNGQVWEQNQAEGPIFPEVGDPVTIEPGKMGSYFLTVRGRWTKVHRVR